MFIIVQIRNVFGNELVYPVSAGAQIFCDLVGTKTLTPHHIQQIKKLGYEVRIETTTPTTL